MLWKKKRETESRLFVWLHSSRPGLSIDLRCRLYLMCFSNQDQGRVVGIERLHTPIDWTVGVCEGSVDRIDRNQTGQSNPSDNRLIRTLQLIFWQNYFWSHNEAEELMNIKLYLDKVPVNLLSLLTVSAFKDYGFPSCIKLLS